MFYFSPGILVKDFPKFVANDIMWPPMNPKYSIWDGHRCWVPFQYPRSQNNKDKDEVGSLLEFTEDDYTITLDVRQFGDDVTVRLKGVHLEVEAKHDEEVENGVMTRYFKRRYQFPVGADPSKVECTLSSDGILQVVAPKYVMTGEIVVPIKPEPTEAAEAGPARPAEARPGRARQAEGGPRQARAGGARPRRARANDDANKNRQHA